MKTEQLETLLGAARGHIIFTASRDGMQKKSVRDWLKAAGVQTDVVNGMTVGQMHDVLNDTSDAELVLAQSAISAKGGVFIHAGPHDNSAAAPEIPAPAAGGLEGALASVIQAQLAQHKPGLDRDAVAEICAEVFDASEVDVQATVDARLAVALAPVQPVIDAMAADGKVNASPRTPVLAAIAGGNKIMAELAPYYRPGVDCGSNFLVCSPPSFGKSYTIRKLGTSYDAYFEHGCSTDMDEMSTLLGNPTPDSKGAFVVFDGVLAQAFRRASEGQKVLLLLDEVLRLPEVVQSWLLTILTGVETEAGRVYRLRTRHIVQSTGEVRGNLEVIECKCENLHFVAATNLTMTMPVQAFWSRWETLRIEFNKTDAAATATSILKAKGIDCARGRLATKFANVMSDSRQSVKKGTTAMPIDFRMLERAAMVAADPTEAAVGQQVAKRLSDNTALWDGDLGDTDSHSAETVAAWTNSLRSL